MLFLASVGVALIVLNPNLVGMLLRPGLIEFGFKRREEPYNLAKRPVGDRMTYETLIL